MRTICTSLLLFAAFSGSAQGISNTGFENWSIQQSYVTDTVPNNWSGLYCNTVLPTTDAFEGSYAAKITGYLMCGIAQGTMINGQMPSSLQYIRGGTPFTGKPSSVSAYYKMTNAQTGDSAEAIVILKKYNFTLMRPDTIAFGYLALPPANNYTLFTVNLVDMQPNVQPDSIVIVFNSSKHYLIDWTTGVLPSLYIDKLKMPEAVTSVQEMENAGVNVLAFPNPYHSSFQLQIDAGNIALEELSLQLFDAAGREVLRFGQLRENVVTIERDALPAGNYVYRLQHKSKTVASGQVVAE